jgi:2-oxoglutarate ferredoxin oxidoreductase subunit beta
MERLIRGGLQHKGFAVIEVMANCHTQYGRRNKYPDPADLMHHIAEGAVSLTQWEKMSPEERQGKYPIGVLHKDTTKPELCERYAVLRERATAKARKDAKTEEKETVTARDEILGATSGEN